MFGAAWAWAQVEVHQYYVGADGGGELYGAVGVGGLAYYGEVVLAF